MAVVVQKYGGSSVADVEKIRKVAERIVRTRREGHDVVVTVSAMGDTTDDLLALAKQVANEPSRRELDMLLTAGERISMALLSMAIHELGEDAVSLTGSQSGIITNDQHSGARIVEVRPFRIQDELARGRIVIVAGFQGVSYKREVTTLGRGGTDTTAVALAAALDAQWCEICSDVDGVYTADPRVVDDASKIAELSYEEMQEMAEAGAKVLHAAAVEFAKEKGIAIYARHSFEENKGTVVRKFGPRTAGRVIGVASESNILVLTSDAGDAAGWENTLAKLQDAGLSGKQLHAGKQGLVLVLKTDVGNVDGLDVTDGLGAISLIGAGINDTHETLRTGMRTLEDAGIAAHSVATSSFRVTYLVERERVEDGVRALHAAFLADGVPVP